MVMITLYARQQKRHRCIEQSFELCGRDGMIWEKGMDTCTPMVDSCQCMAKLIQYCKVK